MKVTHLCVAITEHSEECLYINGERWKYPGETTVYCTDVAEAAGGELLRFEHREVFAPVGEDDDGRLVVAWPLKLDELQLRTDTADEPEGVTPTEHQADTPAEQTDGAG